MIVISDTSVISGLLLIDQLILLKRLFGKILIPSAVKHELLTLKQFAVDLTQFEEAHWIAIQDPSNKSLENFLLDSLDKGESAAISLALELNADYLAIDEKAGRKIAKSMGIKIIGLVGILILAKEKKLIDSVKPYLDRVILEAGFYIGPTFYQKILQDIGEAT